MHSATTTYGISRIGLTKRQVLGLLVFLVLSLGYQFIANDNGATTIIPYSAHTIDTDNRNVGPFDSQEVSSLRYRHWLGTDAIGRDVLAGLIWGSHVALKVGLLSTLLALLIGFIAGYLSGYVGDDSFKISSLNAVITVLLFLLSIFYFIYGVGIWKWGPIVIILLWSVWIIKNHDPDYMGKNKMAIPLDMIVMRIIEIFRAIPTIFVVLILIGLFATPSLYNVIIVIAIIRWPIIARYLRSEILKLKKADHVKASRALGLSGFEIFRKNILPLAVSPVIVSSAFAFSGSILLESTLSFLGIGIPVDEVTWGSILNGARFSFSSWWLALFPGLAIYLVIILFHSIGDNLNENLRGTLER